METGHKIANFVEGRPLSELMIEDHLERAGALWRIFQCLQWHNVALYKDGIGLSEELKIDFNFFAKQYLIKIEGLFEGLEKIISKVPK